MARRRPGTLIPLEISILMCGLELRRDGTAQFHGYLLAGELAEKAGAKRLTAHGTLYKALSRMEDMGLLESEWEDADLATFEERPRRRMYSVTVDGEHALARAKASGAGDTGRGNLGLEPS